MAKPVLILVDDEEAGRYALARELESRYGVHYRIVSSSSPETALARLTEFRAQGVTVPLVLADLRMPGMMGTEFLARVRDIAPTARRGLLITWDDLATSGPILAALALGQMEFYVPRPAWSPDEQFHRAITESLEEWWRERGGRFEAVTVAGRATGESLGAHLAGGPAPPGRRLGAAGGMDRPGPRPVGRPPRAGLRVRRE